MGRRHPVSFLTPPPGGKRSPWRVCRDIAHKPATDTWDRLIGRLASRQHGVVAARQLVAIGIPRDAIAYRARRGRLVAIHRGVYAVGHEALSNEGRWMAAVLAAGEGSVLSHRSAAEHWKMLDPATGPVHVTVRRPAGRERRRGLTVHRSGTLLTSQTTFEDGIPVTTPARTLSDLRRVVTPPVYRHAVRRAEYRRLPLEDTATDRTRSELERIFLRLCRRHGLPTPETNVAVGPYTVDFAWPRERLIVEVDGWEGHGFRSAFEDDRRRDADLAVMGWQVVRFTYARITEAPGAVAATIRYLLAQRERRVAGL